MITFKINSMSNLTSIPRGFNNEELEAATAKYGRLVSALLQNKLGPLSPNIHRQATPSPSV